MGPARAGRGFPQGGNDLHQGRAALAKIHKIAWHLQEIVRRQAPRGKTGPRLMLENKTLACCFGDAIGALGGTRTPNLLIRSQMLYPLSYERLMPG